jgi:hypothetical protein
MREEVEVLEDHSDLGSFGADLTVAQFVELAALLAVTD